MLSPVLRGLMDLLWPPRTACLLCSGALTQSPVPNACKACAESLGFPAGISCCEECSRPTLDKARLCVECAEGSQFGRAFAIGLHSGPLREAIHHLKFNNRDDLGLPLGRLLASRVTPPVDGLVPIPLHRGRQRERGYNQAELLARGLAAQLRVPVWGSSLLRTRSTGHQAKLDRAERLNNLEGAFQAASGVLPWVGKVVLLVDDVLTTGATAAAAASVLRQTGATSVNLAVLAVSTTPVGAVRNRSEYAGIGSVEG